MEAIKPVATMRLLSIFYSSGGDLDVGWWAVIGCSDGKREYRYLWEDAAGPDFDDLAAVISDLSNRQGLDAVLLRARENPQLVKRTKAVTPSTLDRGWVQ
jgi:hypothetical protein